MSFVRAEISLPLRRKLFRATLRFFIFRSVGKYNEKKNFCPFLLIYFENDRRTF